MSPANQLAQITSLTILATSTRSLQLCCHGNFHALDGNRCLPHRCLVVTICRIMVVSLVRYYGPALFSSCLIYAIIL